MSGKNERNGAKPAMLSIFPSDALLWIPCVCSVYIQWVYGLHKLDFQLYCHISLYEFFPSNSVVSRAQMIIRISKYS